MGQNSSIEWTDATWNPVRGCTRISPGCVKCYAERMAARDLPGLKSPTTGEPFAIITPSGPRWTGKVELIPHMLDVPLKRRKPTTYFVNSMSDLFHESLPDEAIDRVFAVMALCPQHTFQILTKRADRMRAYVQPLTDSHCYAAGSSVARILAAMNAMAGIDVAALRWPLPNVHLGVSVENQEYADKRIPDLLATPAAVRFVSYEPALGPVDFRPHFAWSPKAWSAGHPCLSRLDQIIIGGESGPGARPFDIAWARNTIAQCEAANVACFVKQLGNRPIYEETNSSLVAFGKALSGSASPVFRMVLKDKKGGDMSEWPTDLRVREMPKVAQ